MSGEQREPARWSQPTKEEYRRFRRLAERRLTGRYHDADDVVSRSLIKFALLPSIQRTRARIEQIIKTEALSHLRSELRAYERGTKASTDRGLAADGALQVGFDRDLMLYRQALAQTAERSGITLTEFDVTVLELFFAGFNQAEIERALGCTRSRVRRSAARWVLVVSAMEE